MLKAEDMRTATDDLVPARKVAEVLGVSKDTVIRHLRDGSLPGGRQWWEGGRWYMQREEFERLQKQLGQQVTKTVVSDF